MGLDSVEIVMGWEQALGVAISDAEAALIRTPGMAIELLVAKMGAIDSYGGVCLTQRGFHRIRLGFVSGSTVTRQEVTPNTKLRLLLPRHQRQELWKSVQAASGLPELPRLAWGFGILIAPVTIADLARAVVSTSPKSLKEAEAPWTRQEIRTIVRAVVAEVSGVQDFSDDADFIYDIGID